MVCLIYPALCIPESLSLHHMSSILFHAGFHTPNTTGEPELESGCDNHVHAYIGHNPIFGLHLWMKSVVCAHVNTVN